MYRRLKEELDQESIGDVKVVTASVGVNLATDVAFNNNETGGTIIELGAYMIHLAEAVFGRTKPETIHTAGTFFDTGLHFKYMYNENCVDTTGG